MNNVRKLTDEGSGVGIYTFGFLEDRASHCDFVDTGVWRDGDNMVSELSTQRLQMYR